MLSVRAVELETNPRMYPFPKGTPASSSLLVKMDTSKIRLDIL